MASKRTTGTGRGEQGWVLEGLLPSIPKGLAGGGAPSGCGCGSGCRRG
uniref:Predicted protein n=1 Tax=Hordeum vulgare subsp. vulgare TaxID=112509 RepID=F2EAG3_HORVV|nr:predicted protein [Hordeum vulgare subsp. vulgare]